MHHPRCEERRRLLVFLLCVCLCVCSVGQLGFSKPNYFRTATYIQQGSPRVPGSRYPTARSSEDIIPTRCYLKTVCALGPHSHVGVVPEAASGVRSERSSQPSVNLSYVRLNAWSSEAYMCSVCLVRSTPHSTARVRCRQRESRFVRWLRW